MTFCDSFLKGLILRKKLSSEISSRLGQEVSTFNLRSIRLLGRSALLGVSVFRSSGESFSLENIIEMKKKSCPEMNALQALTLAGTGSFLA